MVSVTAIFLSFLHSGVRKRLPPIRCRGISYGNGSPMRSSHSRSQRRQRLHSSWIICSLKSHFHFAEVLPGNPFLRGQHDFVAGGGHWHNRPRLNSCGISCRTGCNRTLSQFARLSARRRPIAQPGSRAQPPERQWPGRGRHRLLRRRPGTSISKALPTANDSFRCMPTLSSSTHVIWPIAGTRRSQGISNSEPGMGTARRRPEESKSPSI